MVKGKNQIQKFGMKKIKIFLNSCYLMLAGTEVLGENLPTSKID